MSLPISFESNASKRYQQSGNFKGKTIFFPDDLVIQNIYTSNDEFFKVELSDPDRLPHVNSDKIVDSWNSDPLKFYQNQLNFVTWCSTAGCGVSDEHLLHSNPMISSFLNVTSIIKLEDCSKKRVVQRLFKIFGARLKII